MCPAQRARIAAVPHRQGFTQDVDRGTVLAMGVSSERHELECEMDAIIDLCSELLIDRSCVRDPHLRLLLTAIGQELAKGSPWVAVSKQVAVHYGLGRDLMVRRNQAAVA